MSQKAKTPRFKDTWGNLGNVGASFGLSGLKVGIMLKDLGVRQQDGAPHPQALEEGVAIATPLKNGQSYYMWHKNKVVELLQKTGIEQLSMESKEIYVFCQELSRTVQAAERKRNIFSFALDHANDAVIAKLKKVPKEDRQSTRTLMVEQFKAMRLSPRTIKALFRGAWTD